MLFGKKKGVAGLDVGSSAVKIVELDGKINNLSLVSLGFENLPDDTIIDGQIMELNAVAEIIQNICADHQITTNQVITGVSGHSVIIKNIVLPAMSREELEESIDWHAEEHIPYDLSEVNLDYHITTETADSTQVLIAACKRERIDNLRQAIQLSGKTPLAVDVDTFALQNCYEINYRPEASEVVTLLNIGAATMNVNIVQGTTSLFTRDITIGGSQFTDILQKNLGISFQQAEAVKRGVADAFNDEVEEKSIEPLINNVQFGRSLEFSGGLFSNLSIETQRKELSASQTAEGAAPPKLDTVNFIIRCAYTPSKAGNNSDNSMQANSGTTPNANQPAAGGQTPPQVAQNNGN